MATIKTLLAAFTPSATKSPAYLAGLFIFLSLLAGCQSPKTPDEVTAAFWEALIEDKQTRQWYNPPVSDDQLGAAKGYATPASRDLVEREPYLEEASVQTGQIVINGTDASVETVITTSATDETDKTLTFNTVLAKENDQWQVDYQQTLINISNQPFSGIIRSLKALGDIFNKQLEQQLPLIEKQLESLGQELERQLDEFGRQLERPAQPDKQSPYPGTI